MSHKKPKNRKGQASMESKMSQDVDVLDDDSLVQPSPLRDVDSFTTGGAAIQAPETTPEPGDWNEAATNYIMRTIKNPDPNVCLVCNFKGPFEQCFITRTSVDGYGIGFKGLICPNCGSIRIAKRPNGKFIYGHEPKWKTQEGNGNGD